LNLKYDEPLSNFAYNFYLRHYNVEIKLNDQATVANFIRRTLDAENSMPHVYAGMEREGGAAAGGSSYDAKFAKFKARRAEQRAKVGRCRLTSV